MLVRRLHGLQAFVFQRADVQLPGFHKYFMLLSHTAHSMATHTMAYINKRGGWIDLQDLVSVCVCVCVCHSVCVLRGVINPKIRKLCF